MVLVNVKFMEIKKAKRKCTHSWKGNWAHAIERKKALYFLFTPVAS